MGQTIKGYLVEYSTGSYEDYHTHNVKVFQSKEEAEKCCKEVDRSHNKKTMFDSDESSPNSWYNIYDEIQEIMYDNPEVYINEVELDYCNFNNRNEWDKRQEEVDKEEERLTYEVIRKHFPTWSDKKIKNALDREDEISSQETWDYGKARIEEIDIVLN